MSLSKDPTYIASPATSKKKRTYQPPELVLHGDLKKVTMGVSAGVGDSLDPFTRKSGFAPKPPGT